MKNLLKTMALLALVILTAAKATMANDLGDEFGGPGIGMKASTYDGSLISRIFGYGDLNNIAGAEINNHRAAASDGPTGYIVYDDTNPIDHHAIDKGPASATTEAYSSHFINDDGPGMDVKTNEYGKATYYDDHGPGMNTVSGFTNTENVANVANVGNGPTVSTSKITPASILSFLFKTPKELAETAVSKKNKKAGE